MGKVERWLGGRLKDIRGFIEGLYEHDLHAKRVDALAGATLGVMTSASLAVAVIGQALAQARGLVTKHAIKQVDRLLSNQNIDVWDSFARWVPHLIGTRKEIVVAVDWTEFDRDGQATLALNLVTGHGRATPLLWVTVWKEELTDQRNDFEDACLLRLKQLVPPDCAVTVLADRGFGDHKLFKFLDDLGFGYVIRFRGNIHLRAGSDRFAHGIAGSGARSAGLRAPQRIQTRYGVVRKHRDGSAREDRKNSSPRMLVETEDVTTLLSKVAELISLRATRRSERTLRLTANN